MMQQCSVFSVQCSVVDTPSSPAEVTKPLIVGVMGGIGAGKSAVAAALAARAGGRVVVADALGHEALRVPEIRDALVRRFGETILESSPSGVAGVEDPGTGDTLPSLGSKGQATGVYDPSHTPPSIDRKRLAAIVFANKSDIAYLESLSHPYIRRRLEDEARRAAEEHSPLLVIDAALLLEAGWDGVCDKLLFVDASPEVRLERLTSKRGWSVEDAQLREAVQLPLTRKRSVADHIIDNSSSHDALVRQIDDLLDRWGLAREPASPAGGLPDAG